MDRLLKPHDKTKRLIAKVQKSVRKEEEGKVAKDGNMNLPPNLVKFLKTHPELQPPKLSPEMLKTLNG